MKPRPIPVDLSIDFDFFARESWVWDWSHTEVGPRRDLYEVHAWASRYASLDLFAEMDPARWCEVTPTAMIEALVARLGHRPEGARPEPIYVADHHVEIVRSALFKAPYPAALLHIDAHHDAYWPAERAIAAREAHPHGALPAETDNWVQHYLDLTADETMTAWVPPRWQVEQQPDPPHPSFVLERELPVLRWDSALDALGALGKGAYLRRVLLVRSPAWTPPHMDVAFVRFVADWCRLTRRKSVQLEPMVSRPAITREQAKAWHTGWKADMGEKMRALAATLRASEAGRSNAD